jgi:hypothetical protein
MQEVEAGGPQFCDSLGNLVRSCLKIKFKKEWGCGSVADHLAGMCDALGLIPTMGRKGKKALAIQKLI